MVIDLKRHGGDGKTVPPVSSRELTCVPLPGNGLIQVFEKHVHIESVGIAPLLQAFILGTHAPDAPKIVFPEHLDGFGIVPHKFEKGHLFGDCLAHGNPFRYHSAIRT